MLPSRARDIAARAQGGDEARVARARSEVGRSTSINKVGEVKEKCGF